MCEDLEGATQEVNKVHEIAAGPAVRLCHAPFIISQLNEFINLLVEFGVYFSFGCMSGILKIRNHAFNMFLKCINTGKTNYEIR